MNIIYDILVNNRMEGHVALTDDLNLEVHIHDDVFKFKSIEGLFDYLNKNNYKIEDMQGDVYTREIHEEHIRVLSKIGIGYYFR